MGIIARNHDRLNFDLVMPGEAHAIPGTGASGLLERTTADGRKDFLVRFRVKDMDGNYNENRVMTVQINCVKSVKVALEMIEGYCRQHQFHTLDDERFQAAKLKLISKPLAVVVNTKREGQKSAEVVFFKRDHHHGGLRHVFGPRVNHIGEAVQYGQSKIMSLDHETLHQIKGLKQGIVGGRAMAMPPVPPPPPPVRGAPAPIPPAPAPAPLAPRDREGHNLPPPPANVWRANDASDIESVSSSESESEEILEEEVVTGSDYETAANSIVNSDSEYASVSSDYETPPSDEERDNVSLEAEIERDQLLEEETDGLIVTLEREKEAVAQDEVISRRVLANGTVIEEIPNDGISTPVQPTPTGKVEVTGTVEEVQNARVKVRLRKQTLAEID